MSGSPSRAGCFVKIVSTVAAVIIGLFLLVDCAGRSRVEHELEALRESGASLTLTDVDVGPGREGADPVPWFAKLDDHEEHWDSSVLNNDVWILELMAELGAGEDTQLADRVGRMLGDYLACAKGKSLEEFRGEIDRMLDRGVTWNELDECQRIALKLDHENVRHMQDVLLEACRHASVDAASILEEQSRAPFESPVAHYVFALMRGVLAPVTSAPYEALNGDTDRALEIVRSGLCAAEITANLPFLVANAAWTAELTATLISLRRVLPHVPAEQDLADIEEMLEKIDVRSSMVRALDGERAWGLDVFAGIGARGMELPRGSFFLVTRRFDQAEYLRHYRELIARLESDTSPSLPARTDLKVDFPFYAPLASMMAPQLSSIIGGSYELEAELLLARAALLARREGMEAAQRFCEERRDPFRADHSFGDPGFGHRVDPDGTLVMWSVGRDGVDDGGSDACTPDGDRVDQVWRVSPPR